MRFQFQEMSVRSRNSSFRISIATYFLSFSDFSVRSKPQSFETIFELKSSKTGVDDPVIHDSRSIIVTGGEARWLNRTGD